MKVFRWRAASIFFVLCNLQMSILVFVTSFLLSTSCPSQLTPFHPHRDYFFQIIIDPYFAVGKPVQKGP